MLLHTNSRLVAYKYLTMIAAFPVILSLHVYSTVYKSESQETFVVPGSAEHSK